MTCKLFDLCPAKLLNLGVREKYALLFIKIALHSMALGGLYYYKPVWLIDLVCMTQDRRKKCALRKDEYYIVLNKDIICAASIIHL